MDRIYSLFFVISFSLLAACSGSNSDGSGESSTVSFEEFASSSSAVVLNDSTENSGGLLLEANAQLSSSSDAQNEIVVPWPRFATEAFFYRSAKEETHNDLEAYLHTLVDASVDLAQDIGATVLQGIDSWDQAITEYQAETSYIALNDFEINRVFATQTMNEAGGASVNVEDLTGQDPDADYLDFFGSDARFGNEWSTNLAQVDRLRMLQVNYLQVGLNYAQAGLQVVSREGVFKRDGVFYQHPVIEIFAEVLAYENEDYVARKLDSLDVGLDYILVTPKSGIIDDASDLYDFYQELAKDPQNEWSISDSNFVLPSIDWTIEHAEVEYGDVYSEIDADLRGLNNQGGLYAKPLPAMSRLVVSAEELKVRSVNGTVIRYSPQNISGFDPFRNGGGANLTLSSGNHNDNYYSWECGDQIVDVDFEPSLLIIEHRESGQVIASASISSLPDAEEIRLCLEP